MPLSKEETEKVTDELQAMIDRDKKAKPLRKSRKEYIRDSKTTLQDLLYNDINGKRIPRSTDIVQSPNNHINFYLKNYGIGNCYFLAPLIFLAKNDPNFIMKNLIVPNSSDKNEVTVNFHNEEKLISVNVKKDEAIRWKSAHKAFWPIVLELAFVKLVQQHDKVLKDKDFMEYMENTTTRTRSFVFDGGDCSPIYEIFTGRKAKIKKFEPPNKPSNKSFETTVYSPEALRLYNKVDKCLKSKKMVCAAFHKFKHTSAYSLGKEIAMISRSLDPLISELDKDKKSQLISHNTNLLYHFFWCVFEPPGIPLNLYAAKKDKEDYISRKIEDFQKYSNKEKEEYIKKFITSLMNSVKGISKSDKTGIYSSHAYAVVGCREQDGFKYIIIANPHGTMTKIDYTHKIEKLRKEGKLPQLVKTPQDIDNTHGECAMELNHFHKKLSALEYEYDPRKKESYEALREMFNEVH